MRRFPGFVRTASILILILLPSLKVSAQTAIQPPQTLGTVERLDPRLDKLISPGAQVEKIAEGFDWSEGPIWDKANRRLLFSDVPRNTVYAWDGTRVSIFLSPSGYMGGPDRGGETGSNGLTLDSEGRLTLMQHGDRRVAKLGKDRQFLVMADRYEGKRLNSPNDGVYKSNGDFYFTDPPYGLPNQARDTTKELPFHGVYKLSKSGELTVLTKEMTFPNGIAFSPDEKTLYVANSDPKRAIWMAFPVKDDGTVGEGKVFRDVTAMVGKRPGLPDGMKVDRSGNLFATGPGGVLIFSPEGDHLGTLATGQATANCNWGGDQGDELYITADMFLGRIKTTTRGAAGAR